MYYLVFSYYKDYSKTTKLSSLVFETSNSSIASEMLKFFIYVKNGQYVHYKLKDEYRGYTSIFYIDIVESTEIRQQFAELENLLTNTSISFSIKNEVSSFLRFLQSVTKIIAKSNTFHAVLELISVSDIFSVD